MFSGGEPTIHPQILDFIKMAQDKGVNMVTLNTNGIRLAHDRKFVRRAGRAHSRLESTCSSTASTSATHIEIRGRDLRAAKQKALDNCAEFGLDASRWWRPSRRASTSTSWATSCASASSTRPCGRWPTSPSPTRAATSSSTPCSGSPTPTSSTAWSTSARSGSELSDFVPVPCCFPTCRSHHLPAGRTATTSCPIPRLVNVDDYLDYVSNRVMPDMASGAPSRSCGARRRYRHGDDGNTHRASWSAPPAASTCPRR